MTEHGYEAEGRCPGCPRHCELSEPGCERGEQYARGIEPPESEHAHHYRPDNGLEWASGPHRWPEDSGHHHRGPHGPGPGPHRPGPHGPHGPGPHGRGPRPEPPEPEPDRDSLLGLMRRCGHYLAHRAGAVSSRERMLRLLAERGEMPQADFVKLLDLRSASVSEQLGKLEAQGLVVRRRSEQDRRGVTIELSEQGRELAQAIGGRDSEGAFGALDEAERETLKALLEKLLSDWEGE